MKTHSLLSLVLSTSFVLVHQAAVRAGNFAPAVSYSVGAGTVFVAGAKANGSARTDFLISANAADGTLTILTNDGSGIFGTDDTVTAGTAPQCVAAADVNGNGTIYLFSADSGDNTVTVFTNDASGKFGYNDKQTVGSCPVSVITVDVNGDGKLDLVTANFRSDGYGNTLTVLTNNGSGRFGYNATLVVGLGPFAIAAADVNGDSKPDLISADANGTSLTVLTNNGTGGFGFKATLPVGTYPQSVAAADVNGDGKVDLISANTSGNSLTVLTNNGSGSFGLYTTVYNGFGESSYPASVKAADVNGDGKVELICANFGDNFLAVYTNNGAGGFGRNETLAVDQGPNSVALVDADGDGLTDLVSANYLDNTLTLLLNNAPPPTPALAISFTAPDTIVVSWPLSATGFVLQQNSDLTTTNWPDYSGSLSTNETSVSATISPVAGNSFYRLYRP
jgi:hypothetical protein